MFQYLYWPNDWGKEIALQLRRSQFQVLVITDSKYFDLIESELFRFQNRGGHVELIACLYSWEKTIKRINALKRLGNAGGTIGLISLSDLTTPPPNSIVLDKTRLISEALLDQTELPRELIFQQEKIWIQYFERAEQMQPSSSEVQVHFQIQPIFVEPGEMVILYWEVHNADFAEIEPGIGAVKLEGQMEVPVFEDTLFRLKVGNTNSVRSKSVFIKTAVQKHIRISLYVLDPVSKVYIPLESSSDQGQVYAVFAGDKVKVEWSSLPMGKLSEARLGDISNESFIYLEIFADEEFVFTLRTMHDDFIERIQILTVNNENRIITKPLVLTESFQVSEIEVHEQKGSTFSLNQLFKKLLNLLTKRK